MSIIKWTFGLLFCLTSLSFGMEIIGDESREKAIFLQEESTWAEETLATMDLDQKIGQLFMVAAYSNKDKAHKNEILKLINNNHIGGLIFMQGDPVSQANLTNIYQKATKIPLLLAMDAEWGLSMRLKNTTSFPRQMAMGAMRDTALVYDFGAEMARQCQRLGVHVSFSPVVDVNNNSKNPVINNRSFGEKKELVAINGEAYMKGLQDNRVLACAKHFPGHGDTNVDSHLDLPVINHSATRLKNIELYPFRHLIKKGLGSLMVAHLSIPALDSTENQASTLSKPIVTDLLKKEMGFEGLIFTDAMNMQGVAKHYELGESDVQALIAGNDVLLIPENVGIAIQKIKDAIKDGRLTEEMIDDKVLRILKVKDWTGAKDRKEISTKNLVSDLNLPSVKTLRQKIVQKSLTVLKNKEKMIPLKDMDKQNIATLTVGKGIKNSFNSKFKEYTDFDTYTMSNQAMFEDTKTISNKLSEYDLVIINLMGATNNVERNYGVSQQSLLMANSIAKKSKVILNVFANPYSLNKAPRIEANTLVIAYHDTHVTQVAMAELMVGAIGASGKLPVTPNGSYAFGLGLVLEDVVRLQTVDPSYFNINEEQLKIIDKIAKQGIDEQAYPGCRVLAIKDGKLFLDRSYGHLTYEEKKKVGSETVYDLASITKVSATIPSLMKLQSQGLFDVDQTLGTYYEMDDTSAYNDLNMKEMLAHYAKLKPWIPFYLNTIDEGQLKKNIYKKTSRVGYSVEVAKNLYIQNTYKDSIFDRILANGFLTNKRYRYSDLGYYFFKEIIEKQTEQKMEDFTSENFYKPLGLKTMGYHPLERNKVSIIAPTEYDLFFRHQVIRGYVHDPGAAMLGGVGGHAGVFSNGYDLAVLMQMFLNGGEYGGKRFFDQEVIDYYTDCPYCEDRNRRGVGFDKPTFKLDNGSTCNSASASSFGHSGFTGTLVWADPEHDLIYVFLSNRVYPNAENRKLVNLDIRTRIQQAIYDCFDIPSRAER